MRSVCGCCLVWGICGSGNAIRDTGTRHLAEALKRCPQLQSVDVAGSCGQGVLAMIAGSLLHVLSAGSDVVVCRWRVIAGSVCVAAA